MKIDGYKLREAIKQHELKAAAALSEFPGSLQKFADEEKPTPFEVSLEIEQAELALAKLRTAQAQYNIRIRVPFRNDEITLAEAVKSIVALGKVEKLWKDLATSRGNRHAHIYGSQQQTRDANQIVSSPTTTSAECVAQTKKISTELGRLKQAIATANAREVEIEGLDQTLFESV
jgi:hypothetical protein